MLLRIVSVSAIVLSTITIPAAAASAEVVEAMSRDFGITAAQALTRIRDRWPYRVSMPRPWSTLMRLP